MEGIVSLKVDSCLYENLVEISFPINVETVNNPVSGKTEYPCRRLSVLHYVY